MSVKCLLFMCPLTTETNHCAIVK